MKENQMKKIEKTESNLNQKPQILSPILTVEIPYERTKRSFLLKEKSYQVLVQYASYLSQHHGTKIDEDKVVESLIETLKKDKGFLSFEKKENPPDD